MAFEDDGLGLVVVEDSERPKRAQLIPELSNHVNDKLDERSQDGDSHDASAKSAGRGEPHRVAAHGEHQGGHVRQAGKERPRIDEQLSAVNRRSQVKQAKHPSAEPIARPQAQAQNRNHYQVDPEMSQDHLISCQRL